MTSVHALLKILIDELYQLHLLEFAHKKSRLQCGNAPHPKNDAAQKYTPEPTNVLECIPKIVFSL